MTEVLVVPQQSATITTARGRKFLVDAAGVAELDVSVSSGGRGLLLEAIPGESYGYRASYTNNCNRLYSYDDKSFCKGLGHNMRYVENMCVPKGWPQRDFPDATRCESLKQAPPSTPPATRLRAPQPR